MGENVLAKGNSLQPHKVQITQLFSFFKTQYIRLKHFILSTFTSKEKSVKKIHV